ncbi:hypothetical protein [Halovenus halobia]|uniref:hypothetical protein n=1 Tax=Halovenus halobia TaxID=3396622 RepID=UPI003F55E499
MIHESIVTTVRGYGQQFWRDLLSIYYANTPIWRWLKSGALLFLGFGLWAGGSAVHSVTDWRPVLYVMAYGFLLIVWGPFTHMVLVPLTVRLRRNASTAVGRTFSRNSGKINLTIFALCVISLATLAPGVMLLEFSPSTGTGAQSVSGDLVCDGGEQTVSCEIVDPQGIDHVVVLSGGEQLKRVDGSPFTFTVDRSNLKESPTGQELVVEYRDENGQLRQRLIRSF